MTKNAENTDAKVVLIIGAGSTYADSGTPIDHKKPPLDNKFFEMSRKTNRQEVEEIEKFFLEKYGIKIEEEYDRLEKVMAILYTDTFHPSLGKEAYEIWRKLILLYNERIAETTNQITPNNRSSLFKLIAHYLSDRKPKVKPENITFITFNHDVHIEHTLESFKNYKKYKKYSNILKFPDCYRVNFDGQTNPSGKNVPKFDVSIEPGPQILKLHGSLNWHSPHKASHERIKMKDFLKTDRKITYTTRKRIETKIKIKGKGGNKLLPLIVPPVPSKMTIIPNKLKNIWTKAEDAIKKSNEIVIYGYSLPEADMESANMIRRSIKGNDRLSSVSIINPDYQVMSRYLDVLQADFASYYKNVKQFITAD